jgi:hypothetical protein
MTIISPETKPMPIVVIDGHVVHRASLTRQILGARPTTPARHGRRPDLRDIAVRSLLDKVIHAFVWAVLGTVLVKVGFAGWALMWVGTWAVAGVFLILSWLPL